MIFDKYAEKTKTRYKMIEIQRYGRIRVIRAFSWVGSNPLYPLLVSGDL